MITCVCCGVLEIGVCAAILSIMGISKAKKAKKCDKVGK